MFFRVFPPFFWDHYDNSQTKSFPFAYKDYNSASGRALGIPVKL